VRARPAHILGATIPDTAAEDSMTVLPLLRGTAIPPRRGSIVNHSADGEFAIREGRWKLLLCPGSGGWSPPTAAPSQWLKTDAADLSKLPPFQLYDLTADPAEQKNLAAAHPEVVQRLGRRLRADIDRGRSTPGASQPVETAGWPQVAWMRVFAN
jgi:arylsulfatase A